MHPQRLRILVFGALIIAAAGPARGDSRPLKAEAPKLLLSARPDLARKVAEADALRAAGFARTSVDRRLADEGLTASAGFLCGLQPGRHADGGAGAYGYDPHGRFVGAKLSLSF